MNKLHVLFKIMFSSDRKKVELKLFIRTFENQCRQMQDPDFGTESTVCPRRVDPFYILTYYIKRVKTAWSYSTYLRLGSGEAVEQPGGLTQLLQLRRDQTHLQLMYTCTYTVTYVHCTIYIFPWN